MKVYIKVYKATVIFPERVFFNIAQVSEKHFKQLRNPYNLLSKHDYSSRRKPRSVGRLQILAVSSLPHILQNVFMLPASGFALLIMSAFLKRITGNGPAAVLREHNMAALYG